MDYVNEVRPAAMRFQLVDTALGRSVLELCI